MTNVTPIKGADKPATESTLLATPVKVINAFHFWIGAEIDQQHFGMFIAHHNQAEHVHGLSDRGFICEGDTIFHCGYVVIDKAKMLLFMKGLKNELPYGAAAANGIFFATGDAYWMVNKAARDALKKQAKQRQEVAEAINKLGLGSIVIKEES